MEKKFICYLCQTEMQRDEQEDCWVCPCCGSTFWVFEERPLTEKDIYDLMMPSAGWRRKGGGTRNKKKYKTRKAGMKFVPWYRR